jgi:hypothetical protein
MMSYQYLSQTKSQDEDFDFILDHLGLDAGNTASGEVLEAVIEVLVRTKECRGGTPKPRNASGSGYVCEAV